MKRAARAIRGNDIFAIKQVKEDQDEPLQEEVEYYQDSKGRLPLSPVDPELSLPFGRRPVLLLSRDTAYRVRTSVTVGMVTRTIRAIPVEVPLGPGDEMPEQCVVNLDNILTIPNARLAEQLGLGWRDLDLNLAKIFQET